MVKATKTSTPTVASKLVGGQVRKSALKSNGEVSKEALKKAEAMGPTAKFKGLTRQQKDDLARAVIAKASPSKGGEIKKVEKVQSKQKGNVTKVQQAAGNVQKVPQVEAKLKSAVKLQQVPQVEAPPKVNTNGKKAEKVDAKQKGEGKVGKVQKACEPAAKQKVESDDQKCEKGAKQKGMLKEAKAKETKPENAKQPAKTVPKEVKPDEQGSSKKREAPATPPTRRVSFKSPVSVVSTYSASSDADAASYKQKREKAVDALKDAVDLSSAAVQSQLQAEMDAGGLSAFLESMAENGHVGDLSAALLAASLKKKSEEEAKAGVTQAQQDGAEESDQQGCEGEHEAEEEEAEEPDTEVEVEAADSEHEEAAPEQVDAEMEEEEEEDVGEEEDSAGRRMTTPQRRSMARMRSSRYLETSELLLGRYFFLCVIVSGDWGAISVMSAGNCFPVPERAAPQLVLLYA